MITGYKKLELLVAIDTVLSETASIAHYVLPESFYLERDEAVDTKHSGKRAQVSLQQKVVKPLYDTRPGTQIIIELAKQLGIEKYFNFDIEEANRLRLKPLGVTLEQLKEKGILFVGEEWKERFNKLETPSGKVEIYCKTLEQLGFPPIPRWEEPLVSPDLKDPHSFRLLHGIQAMAGLAGLPGGGAEMLDDEVRQRVSPKKQSAAGWVEAMGIAHRLGLTTTATMVIGLGETVEQRIGHLQKLRDLQDESRRAHRHGFTAFIAWTLQTDNTPMGRSKGREEYGASANEYLRLAAVARLFLDNFEHVQAFWPTQGLRLAEVALEFGWDDFGSTMLEENVVSAAGTSAEKRDALLQGKPHDEIILGGEVFDFSDLIGKGKGVLYPARAALIDQAGGGAEGNVAGSFSFPSRANDAEHLAAEQAGMIDVSAVIPEASQLPMVGEAHRGYRD